MAKNVDFSKSIGGGFDRIELSATRDSDWLALRLHVGNHVETITITLRGAEAVRDLHYALGRYLALLDEDEPTP